ncbi:MAG: tetraacyldisaccharide 4'-kinase [Alphaproteobacteria bacterium]|nr:tetraacyldisaccharide 4'-kinase [Alphaproteobacteria bacterium]
MRAPEFWHDRTSPLGALLTPLAAVYRLASVLHNAVAQPRRASVPVVCIGNLVAGGAGKTTVALAVGAWLRAQGLAVHFLSRGYGGRLRGPVRVDPRTHTARDVGDEPLLLAELASTWVSRDRPAGAQAAADAGADVVVMDDGFQNPSLIKDVSLVVVDAGYGFGNRRLLPAGPLREPIAAGLKRAQALVLLDGKGQNVATLTGGGLPLLAGRTVPEAGSMRFSDRRVYPFAGIGRPRKFFDMLENMGCVVVGRRAFPDHHAFTPEEIMEICEIAAAADAVPVTTAKDAVRLMPEARPMVEVVRVRLEWRDEAALERVLRPVVHQAKSALSA